MVSNTDERNGQELGNGGTRHLGIELRQVLLLALGVLSSVAPTIFPAKLMADSGIDLGGDHLVFVSAQKRHDPRACQAMAVRWGYSSSLLDRAADSYPFWDDVELGDFDPRIERDGKEGATAIYRRRSGEYSWAEWDGIGPFIRDIQTARQCESVLEVLHDNWSYARLNGQQCADIVHSVRNSAAGLPLRLKAPDVSRETMTAQCVRKNGVWLTHFAIIEGACLVEYKYAIDSRGRIARLRRVLVEGPEDVVHSARWTFEAGFTVSPVATEQQQKYAPCRNYLLALAYLARPRGSATVREPRERLMTVRTLNYCFLFLSPELEPRGLRQCATRDFEASLADGDDDVRRHAAFGLASVDNEKLIQVMHADLFSKDRTVRRRALSDLAAQGRPACVRELLLSLQNSDANDRHDVIDALESSELDYVAATGRELTAGDAATRAAAAWALGRFGAAASVATPELKKLLADQDRQVRQSAAESLERITKAENELAQVHAWVKNSDVRALAGMLSRDDATIRAATAAGLVEVGRRAGDAVPELRAVLNKPPSDIPSDAVKVLKNIGIAAKPAVPELAFLVSHVANDRWDRPYAPSAPQDRATMVRDIAADVLFDLGPEAAAAVPDLRAAMKDRRTSVRQTAARLLGRIGSGAKAAIPDLRYALSDPSSAVREAAALALHEIDRAEGRVSVPGPDREKKP